MAGAVAKFLLGYALRGGGLCGYGHFAKDILCEAYIILAKTLPHLLAHVNERGRISVMHRSSRAEKMQRPRERLRNQDKEHPRRKEVLCMACPQKFWVQRGKTTNCPECGVPFPYNVIEKSRYQVSRTIFHRPNSKTRR